MQVHNEYCNFHPILPFLIATLSPEKKPFVFATRSPSYFDVFLLCDPLHLTRIACISMVRVCMRACVYVHACMRVCLCVCVCDLLGEAVQGKQFKKDGLLW